MASQSSKQKEQLAGSMPTLFAERRQWAADLER